MSKLLANRLKAVKPSPTLQIAAKAAELKEQGIDITSLSTGEPDFDTPINIQNAGIAAIKSGKTRYTPASGMPNLKAAICKKFQTENNLIYNNKEIIVSCGGKHIIYNLFMATLNDGDEVIIPTPYWVSYPDMVLLTGGVPVTVQSTIEKGFKINAQDLSQAINAKTKWIILNSPSNPSGAVYFEDELKEIAELMKQHPHVNILTDDIYEHIIYDGKKFLNILNVMPELKERVFIINGVSKAYAMTGWRIGYGAGNEHIIKAMSLIQSQSTSNPCSISQVAAIEALEGTQHFIPENVQKFTERRNLITTLLNNIEGINCPIPDGAFYVFPDCRQLMGKKTPNGEIINSCSDFAKYLLEFANVAIVPGVAFGLEGYVRISFALSEEIISKAIAKIADAVANLN